MHVHRRLDRYDLPVTYQTRRTGSPHTLVLTKTKALFEREQAKRKAWESDLDWLDKEKRRFLMEPFGPPPRRGRGRGRRARVYPSSARGGESIKLRGSVVDVERIDAAFSDGKGGRPGFAPRASAGQALPLPVGPATTIIRGYYTLSERR